MNYEVDKEWFDDLGLMRAYKGVDSTNDILHHAYWLLVSQQRIKLADLSRLIDQYRKGDGIKQTWRDPEWERFASHDNLTAYLFITNLWKLKPAISMKPYKHPRDWCFYWSYTKWWGKPLFILYGLIVIATCYRKYYNKKNSLLDTDGKLLYLLRREIQPSWWVDPVCNKLLEWRYGKRYVKLLLDQYFHHSPDHPIREVLK
jgi:hypothetical protein